MITRIEIDGFKTFSNFALDLAPFVVVLGPNASGKSNLFDAIHLLSNLASMDLRSAIGDLRGELHELFRHFGDGTRIAKIRLAVEVLVEPRVQDHWGVEVELKHTRIRYEVVIARRREDRGIERLVVEEEWAKPIAAKQDPWAPYGKKPSREFRARHLHYRGRQNDWLSTTNETTGATFDVHQDGNSGRKRKFPAQWAEATVLSSITTTEFPHLFALKQELQSWRLLQLDPGALRRTSPLGEDDSLKPDGSNLTAVLARIRADTATESRPQGDLATITAQLGSIIPGVTRIEVEEDSHTREYRAYLTMKDGQRFPTRVASDGTLRVLALLTLLSDPRRRGAVCFEEPENGIHPARLRRLVQDLGNLTTDPTINDEFAGEPLTQLLMNSHSPVVLSGLYQNKANAQILFADVIAVANPASPQLVDRHTRVRPILEREQGNLYRVPDIGTVSSFEVEQYLGTVEGGV
ncbi:AAA family ATPase [Nannocystaceae bacterium ST9]